MCAVTLPKVGRGLAKIGQHGQIGSDFGRVWLRTRPTLPRSRPKFARFRRIGADVDPTWTTFSPQPANVGLIRPTIAGFGSDWTELRRLKQISARPWPVWAMSANEARYAFCWATRGGGTVMSPEQVHKLGVDQRAVERALWKWRAEVRAGVKRGLCCNKCPDHGAWCTSRVSSSVGGLARNGEARLVRGARRSHLAASSLVVSFRVRSRARTCVRACVQPCVRMRV